MSDDERPAVPMTDARLAGISSGLDLCHENWLQITNPQSADEWAEHDGDELMDFVSELLREVTRLRAKQ